MGQNSGSSASRTRTSGSPSHVPESRGAVPPAPTGTQQTSDQRPTAGCRPRNLPGALAAAERTQLTVSFIADCQLQIANCLQFVSCNRKFAMKCGGSHGTETRRRPEDVDRFGQGKGLSHV